MDCLAAFGIGSTNFRYAAMTPDGAFLTDPRIEPADPYDLPGQIGDAVDALDAATDRPVEGVGVSTAGLVDPDAGVVRKFDTPEGELLDPIELGPSLERDRSLPLSLANDCNAAALGEWYFGARTDERSVVHVTVGTGIGGGVVEDGRLVRGENGQAGEFGLFPVGPDTGLDSCGVPGAWEAICSGRGIPQYVRHRMRDTAERSRLEGERFTAEDVFDAAAADDPVASACLDRIARYNAGVGAVCNACNPGLVTLGGGVALNNERWMVEGIREYLDDYCFVDPPEIRVTALGDDIGLYGALAASLAGN